MLKLQFTRTQIVAAAMAIVDSSQLLMGMGMVWMLERS